MLVGNRQRADEQESAQHAFQLPGRRPLVDLPAVDQFGHGLQAEVGQGQRLRELFLEHPGVGAGVLQMAVQGVLTQAQDVRQAAEQDGDDQHHLQTDQQAGDDAGAAAGR